MSKPNTPGSKNLEKLFKFSSGNLIGVFWSEPTLVWVGWARIDAVPYMIRVAHPFRSQVFRLLRVAVSESRSPAIKEVTKKMQPRKYSAIPGKMEIIKNGKTLVEGKDFILSGKEVFFI